MAFDACMMRAVLSDLWQRFPDAKIEKVLQPQNDEIDLVIHSGRNSKRLVFNVENEYGEGWENIISHESVAIASLLHDLCKIDTFKIDMRKVFFKSIHDVFGGELKKIVCGGAHRYFHFNDRGGTG